MIDFRQKYFLHKSFITNGRYTYLALVNWIYQCPTPSSLNKNILKYGPIPVSFLFIYVFPTRFLWKKPWASAGFELRSAEEKAATLTIRPPPRPLYKNFCFTTLSQMSHQRQINYSDAHEKNSVGFPTHQFENNKKWYDVHFATINVQKWDCKWLAPGTYKSSGQSYKHFTHINYDSRVVPDLKIPHISTLES